MAFSNTPQQDTYRTTRIQFDGLSTLRSSDIAVQRDCHIINMFYDRLSQENGKERDVSLKKRPGILEIPISLHKVSNSDVIRGYFSEPEEEYCYWAVGNQVWRYSFNVVVPYLENVCTLSTSLGSVGFELFQSSTGSVYVIWTDGTDLWYQQIRVYPGVAATKVVDPDLPTPHKPFPVVLDGYVFLAKNNTIYNSVNDTIDQWDPSNFIDCEMSPDNVRLLCQNKNYIVAVGANSLEFFYDGANATGSPLTRNTSAFKATGYVTGYAKGGDWIYFVGKDRDENLGVYRMRDFEVTRISNEVVDRTIQATTDSITPAGGYQTVGKIISVDGHSFYCLTGLTVTWVYDTDKKMWYEWRNASDGPFALEAVWVRDGGETFVAMANSNQMARMSPTYYQDNGVNFTCSYTTEDFDAGSANKKVCNRVYLKCDRYQSTGTSNALIEWSDDDWADGPTSSQNVNVFSNTPFARRCGQFINRSFRIKYTDNYPIRMKALELELNIGAH